jgi:dipeptidyl-peptidase 4
MARTLSRSSLVTLLALVLSGISLSAQSATGRPAAQDWLPAPAEAANYQQGGTMYAPLMEFVHGLASRTELMNVVKLTETLGRRDVVLAILSDPPVFQPSDLAHIDKPVVLIVNNVHGGEVAGKDASLELMRDLVMGDLRPLLDEVVVLVIPTINPDGAEARRRTNDEGFDMNRDYLKLESQEIQALIAKVTNEWNPHIHVDTHHGGSAPYVLTYQTNMNPAGDANLTRYGNERILPLVRAALRAEDYDGFWYSGPTTVDGVQGWGATSVEPRKQHVYSTLANMVGFLFETPSGTHRVVDNGTRVVPVPQEERYRHQVRGEYIGQRVMVQFAAENPRELMDVVAQARIDAIERGNDVSTSDQVPLEYERVVNFRDSFWRRVGGGGGFGGGGAQQDVRFELVEGAIFTKYEVTRSTTRPWGYLFPNSLAKVIPLLMDHDITVLELTEPVDLEVEVYHATEVTNEEYFQGHYLKKVTADKRTETVSFPAGTFFVPSGQPKSNLISYLFEPETDDNLITWGYLNGQIRATPTAAELATQRAAVEEMDLEPEQRRQFLERIDRQAQQEQRIPLYRLMGKTGMPAVVVRPFNEYERNRYIR